jgi:hypothetical protein
MPDRMSEIQGMCPGVVGFVNSQNNEVGARESPELGLLAPWTVKSWTAKSPYSATIPQPIPKFPHRAVKIPFSGALVTLSSL